jgi:large subunit ribosomal protein L32
MAVPKRRQSKSRSRKRRAQHMRAEAPQTSGCPECGTLRPSHVVCPNCGWYMGRVLVPPVED